MRPKKSGFTLIGILAVLTIALILPTGAGASGTARILYSFKDTPDGAAPFAGVILDSTGNLYGTTSQGGSAGMGTVFKVTRNSDGSWTESVLYSFAGGSDGDEPEAELVFDAAGNLYGTTVGGGDIGCWMRHGLSADAEFRRHLEGERAASLYRGRRVASLFKPHLRHDRESLRHYRMGR